MKAKDIVMSRERIQQMGRTTCDGSMIGLSRTIAEAQAEISFHLGEKVGRKEVVDWLLNDEAIANYYYDSRKGKVQHFVIDNGRWQSQLKEWGIKEGQ